MGAFKRFKETRIERWLIELSDTLKQHGWDVELAYDDRYRGDDLALIAFAPGSAPKAARHCEFQLRRSTKGANISLFVGNKNTLISLASALAHHHRSVRRLDNAKRKFFHRVERMANHLVSSFDQRTKAFPAQHWGQFRKLIANSRKLIANSRKLSGISGRFRERREGAQEDLELCEAGSKVARQSRHYRSAWAAQIGHDDHYRAAPFVDSAAFHVKGAVVTRVIEALRQLPGRTPSDFAIADNIDLSPTAAEKAKDRLGKRRCPARARSCP